MKSVIEIKDNLYTFLKNSALANAITGKVCKQGVRPKGSTKEDIVFSVPANENGQRQEAIVYINIYVKDDIKKDGQHQEATIRLRTLCDLASQTLEVGNIDSYRFSLQSQNVLAVEATQEHVISNKLSFININE